MPTPGDPAKPGSGLSDKTDDAPKPMPLVDADEEMASYVNRAREMIVRKDYPGAIEILQALLNRRQQCFVPTEGGRLYVSLAAAASRVVGELPEEGLKLYRRLYDVEADELLRRARAGMDDGALHDVIRRYFHTGAGDQAMNLLGAILFDRGQFSQAGRCWREILYRYRGTDLDVAVLLAKMAVAHHYAGEGGQAAEVLDTLRAEHADARRRLGGELQPVVAYVEKALTTPVPAPAGGVAAESDWTSLAGSPDGVAVMSACPEPTLQARWTRPECDLQVNPNLTGMAAWLARQRRQPPASPSVLITRAPGGAPSAIRLREGHLISTRGTGSGTGLAAVIHPVVVGGTVIVREAQSVCAYDLLTGEMRWGTGEKDFPLYRSSESGSRNVVVLGGSVNVGEVVEDRGWGTLTAGGGKVFALGRFHCSGPWTRVVRRGPTTVPQSDSSALAAFSLTTEGKLIWSTDEPGRPEVLRYSRFISAPTYVAGRLYVVGVHRFAHYLFCLDAQTGQMLWPKPVFVSQLPMTVAASGRFGSASGMYDRGSAPAVADGRVYVCTNAGVAAAFDADTGRGLWAYQYDSSLNWTAGSANMIRQRRIPRIAYPPNPVIVTRGRVIFLPADSEKMVVLWPDTGEPAWPEVVDRSGQRDLTAVDEGRILLSGPAMSILDVSDGEELWSSARSQHRVRNINGRPAVTPDAILASGQGEVVVVSLPDYLVTPVPLVDQRQSLLGNLLCVDGKLLAANAAGVSAYLSFEDGHRELTERIRKASADDVPNLHYQRGMNAFNAGRPQQGLGDLLRAQALARRRNQTALAERTGQSLYRTYVAMANRCGKNARMGQLFAQARSCAYSDRSRAEMLLRSAKYRSRIGQYAQAAALAQQLAMEFAETDIRDVAIGPEADPYVRDGEDSPRSAGSHLGHKFIKELIGARGQSCYAAFDAKAKAALDAAVAADDVNAMLRVVATYKHSSYAPLALLRAGESLYRKAQGGRKQEARLALLGQAARHVSRVNREYPASGLGASASLGLAMMYRQTSPQLAWLGLQGLSGVPRRTRVSFAGVSGSLGEVLLRLELDAPRPSPPAPALASIRPPLEKLYELKGDVLVIRDARGQAVRLDGSIFVLRGNRLSRFDPSAGSFEAGKRWEVPLPADTGRILTRGFAGWASGMIGGLSSDGSVFVLATREGIFGRRTRTGQEEWTYKPTEPWIARLNWLAVGEGKLAVLDSNGGITVLDVRTGKRVLTHTTARTEMPWRAPPQIGGGLLLAIHGSRAVQATVFDLNRKAPLGAVRLSNPQAGAHLTSHGLLMVCDGGRLRLIEPRLGLDREVWSVALAKNAFPIILGSTDREVIVSPSSQTGLIELRGLAEQGRIVRTFQTAPVRGTAAGPRWARVVGNRLYAITSQAQRGARQQLAGRLQYLRVPSLQVFDLAGGELLAKADLSVGQQANAFVMPPDICRGHVGVLAKQQVFNPALARIIDSGTGRIVQKIEIPPLPQRPRPAPQKHQRHQWLGGPVITKGRVVLEVFEGLWVYGRKESGQSK